MEILKTNEYPFAELPTGTIDDVLDGDAFGSLIVDPPNILSCELLKADDPLVPSANNSAVPVCVPNSATKVVGVFGAIISVGNDHAAIWVCAFAPAENSTVRSSISTPGIPRCFRVSKVFVEIFMCEKFLNDNSDAMCFKKSSYCNSGY